MVEIPVNEGVLQVPGPLTLATVGKIFSDAAGLWSGRDGPSAIDLSKAERIDSAGLALLLEWQAMARHRGGKLELCNPPDDLLRLAALCEASELLGLAQNGETDNPGADP